MPQVRSSPSSAPRWTAEPPAFPPIRHRGCARISFRCTRSIPSVPKRTEISWFGR